ncbi:MAG: DMT family transporter [Actinobacteria bacterium]|nr:DMT family transporter [Actinomycetota bacterium]
MRRNPGMLVAVALIWGASFMFIKIADRQLAPSTLILGRLASAALTLAAFALVRLGARETWREMRRAWPWLLVVAIVNTAMPFWLLSWGEKHLDSGLASIIQAGVPIFVAVAALLVFRESRVSGSRLAGVGLGFVGVALLVGAQPHGKLLAALAVVGMALCYALGQLIAVRHLPETPPLVVALSSTAIAALIAAPAGIAQAPAHVPKAETFAAVLVLGIPGTAVAYLLFFALIQSAGAAYAALVTYLIPPIALAYGAIFLGERFAASAFAALALVLGGVALGTGARLRPQSYRIRGSSSP